MGEEEHRLLITMHHIITDGWSGGVLMRDLGELYQAICEQRAPALRRLKMQYADFCVWQQARLVQGDMEEHLGYWREQLRDLEVTELIPDRILREARTFAGDSVRFELEAAATARLKELARREGCTLFMAALSGFVILLKRYTGRNDVAVGSPVANRTRQEFEDLIGFFVNTVVLRTNMEGNPSYLEVLRRVRETTLGAYTHQDVPFEQVVEHVKPHRKLNENPLFRIMFILHNLPKAEMRVAGLKCFMPEPVSRWSAFDVTVSLEEEGGRLCGHIEYSTELWEQSTIKRLSEHYRRLLAQAAAAPQTRISEFALLEKAEEEQLLKVWNGTGKSGWTGKAVHQLIEAQVERTPEAVAVFAGEKQLSYRELNERANRIAHRLRELGAGPDVVIGICLDRSLEMVVALLAVLKAGAAYLPLDPALPEKRIRHMVEDSQPPSILTRPDLAAPLTWYEGATVYLTPGGDDFQEHNSANLEVPLHPGNLMYVIYTSGSTGKPKGVAVPHLAGLEVTVALTSHWQLIHQDRMLQFCSISWDTALEEIFPVVSVGGSLVLRDEQPLGVFELLELCREKRITLMDLPTALFHQLVSSLSSGSARLPACIRSITIGGEAVGLEYLRQWFQSTHNVQLFNTYGTTEAGAVLTMESLAESDVNGALRYVSIGRPLRHCRAYVLDDSCELVPAGCVGELYVAGSSLGRSYLRLPDMTAASFVPDPFSVSGERMYKTGDLVRWSHAGVLEYCGRSNNLLKVRGHRVELEDVEQCILCMTGVRVCAVISTSDRSGSSKLACFFVPNADFPGIENLRKQMREELPAYMTPSLIFSVDVLPLTPTGKINRLALKDKVPLMTASAQTSRPPSTPTEAAVAALWQEILEVECIGADENVFALGANSLSCIQMAARIHDRFGVELPIHVFFSHSCTSEIASLILETGGEQSPIQFIHGRV